MNHFANNGKEYLRKDPKFDYQGKSEEQYKGSAQACFIAFCIIGTLLAIFKLTQQYEHVRRRDYKKLKANTETHR